MDITFSGHGATVYSVADGHIKVNIAAPKVHIHSRRSHHGDVADSDGQSPAVAPAAVAIPDPDSDETVAANATAASPARPRCPVRQAGAGSGP